MQFHLESVESFTQLEFRAQFRVNAVQNWIVPRRVGLVEKMQDRENWQCHFDAPKIEAARDTHTAGSSSVSIAAQGTPDHSFTRSRGSSIRRSSRSSRASET